MLCLPVGSSWRNSWARLSREEKVLVARWEEEWEERAGERGEWGAGEVLEV